MGQPARSQAGVAASRDELEAAPRGIGGWLMPVAVGLFIHPVRLVRMLGETWETQIAGGGWSALSDPQALAVALETGARIGLLVFSLAMLYLFFRRKRAFRTWYPVISVLSLVLAGAGAWATHQIFPEAQALDTLTRRELLQALAQCLIWVPYVLLSRRCRATFTE